jgi:hypothetical protein
MFLENVDMVVVEQDEKMKMKEKSFLLDLNLSAPLTRVAPSADGDCNTKGSTLSPGGELRRQHSVAVEFAVSFTLSLFLFL